MKTLESLTRDERSLLVYLETCCVDYGGAYEPIRMNDVDRAILNTWADEGFVECGRITSSTWPTPSRCYWAQLSDEAFALAHQERLERYRRRDAHRNWVKTSEFKRPVTDGEDIPA